MVGGLPLPQEWAEHRPAWGRAYPSVKAIKYPASASNERPTAELGLLLATAHAGVICFEALKRN